MYWQKRSPFYNATAYFTCVLKNSDQAWFSTPIEIAEVYDYGYSYRSLNFVLNITNYV